MKQNNSGIAMLSLSAPMMGKVETVFPTLIWDESHTVLIDTGYPGQLPLIQKELARLNAELQSISSFIISHQDLDHIGGAQALIDVMPHRPAVISSEIEKPYIEGEKRLLKLTPAAVELAMSALPENVPPQWRQAFRKTLEHPPSVRVTATCAAGDVLPFCGGITVIATPGHTPGHISLYHQPSKTLIAADALIVDRNGRLQLPDAALCTDYELAKQSVKTLAGYDIDAVICYHGGLFNENANDAIAALAEG